MKDYLKNFATLGVFLLGTLLTVSNGFCAGYAILEQSAEGVGNAFAGATAGYGDGSEVSFNPAAMAWNNGTKITFDAHLIAPSSEFTNEGSLNLGTGSALLGDNGPDGGETAYVPNFYIMHELNSAVHLGLGVNAPFGLATEYSNDWVGRYHGIKTELQTININPAVSVKLDQLFAIGAGLNVMYADAELSNAIDFGTIGVASLGVPTASALGLVPQLSDGYGVVKGDDWGVGYNFGAAFDYCEGSRMGLSWHSKVDINLEGNADFTVPANAMPLTATGLFTDTTGQAAITLPDYANFGWIHQFSKEWSVLGEVQWTHWSRFRELRIDFGSAQPDSVVSEDWDNTWRYSVAVNYRPIDSLTFKTGFTYDESPISADHRTPRIPGNNRKWLALGASYMFSDNFKLDLSYAHLFVSDAESLAVTDATGHVLNGSWDLGVDIVSLGASYQF